MKSTSVVFTIASGVMYIHLQLLANIRPLWPTISVQYSRGPIPLTVNSLLERRVQLGAHLARQKEVIRRRGLLMPVSITDRKREGALPRHLMQNKTLLSLFIRRQAKPGSEVTLTGSHLGCCRWRCRTGPPCRPATARRPAGRGGTRSSYTAGAGRMPSSPGGTWMTVPGYGRHLWGQVRQWL